VYRERVAKLSKSARELFAHYGRIGGKEGGKARARRLTAAALSEAGRKAVQARWASRKWHILIEAFAPDKWPGAETTFRLRTQEKIRVERRGRSRDFVVATATAEASSATAAARAVYWKLRNAGVVRPSSGALVSATATDAVGKPANVVMEAVVQRPTRKS